MWLNARTNYFIYYRAIAAKKTRVTVFEFTSNKDYEYFYMLFNAFTNNNVIFDSKRLLTCGGVVSAISEFLDADDPAFEYR
jgi:hypothetical protein